MKGAYLLQACFGSLIYVFFSIYQTCNIIVKDVKDSKRIDNLIHGYKKSIIPEAEQKNPLLSIDQLHCMSVSKGYWPINYEVEGFPLPKYLQPLFEEYSKRFERNRAMRKLIWHTNLGHVNLSLSFDNGDFEFKCLPIHAVLIGYFDEQSRGIPKISNSLITFVAFFCLFCRV